MLIIVCYCVQERGIKMVYEKDGGDKGWRGWQERERSRGSSDAYYLVFFRSMNKGKERRII